ncbi:DUF4160 domain-containing protein [Lacihabitans lacunae]|jgi:hypothetical protein|uniref:DUF4160 domain-containing protein n=1 Tax=Lacihabitans lacunae TaxID=1028214 RepID=A0ABV7Z2T8_9BACT
MPTLFIIFGLRFYFYSNEHLPIHVHVRNADGEAKFEVEMVRLVSNKGLKNKDISLAIAIIEENKEIIIAKWKEYHGE